MGKHQIKAKATQKRAMRDSISMEIKIITVLLLPFKNDHSSLKGNVVFKKGFFSHIWRKNSNVFTNFENERNF